jgi:hypothetical protein
MFNAVLCEITHDALPALASADKGHKPTFADKEKINLKIYAERQNNAPERERYFTVARTEGHSQQPKVSA